MEEHTKKEKKLGGKMGLERFIVFLNTIYSNKKQFLCYFLVGGLCAIIDLSIFSIFTLLLHFPWLIISVFSFCVATLINFLLSTKFVFINRKANKKKEIKSQVKKTKKAEHKISQFK